MGCYPEKSIALSHEALGVESEHSKMHIYSPEPVDFWHTPDIFCALPPSLIVSLKALLKSRKMMNTNGFRGLDANGVKDDDHDSGQFQTTYRNDYQAASNRMNMMDAQYALTGVPASSPFQGSYHVSPAVSPESSFSANQWVPPTYVQPPGQTYTWPSQQQQFQTRSRYFAGGEGYQTANFQPHGLPNMSFPCGNSWQYANGSAAIPIEPAGHINQQTGFYDPNTTTTTGGSSFSSTHNPGSSFSSTTFSSSFGDNLSVPEAFPPRAFYNSTPIDSYNMSGHVQEITTSPPSPENFFAPGYSMSSSASSPAAMDSDAAQHSSSEPTLAVVSSRPAKKKAPLSKGSRKKLPDKQPRGRHPRRRSSPPPPPKPAGLRRGRSIAPAPQAVASSSSSMIFRHGRNTRSNSNILASQRPNSNENQRQHHQAAAPRPARQAQLRPVMYLSAPAPARHALPAPPSQQQTAPSSPASATPAQILLESKDLSDKDRLLIELKQTGIGYKEIKKVGGFTEAVSTLRGRYRTLTKPKEARVRKPAWTDRDLRLLEQAVRDLVAATTPTCGISDLCTAKIPWMRVAAHISDGGGYRFGNSTCRKRWDELFADETARGKDPRIPFYEQWPVPQLPSQG